MDKAAGWLKKSLQFEFGDADLLRQALTHRSAPGINNERLEYLGDAVLQIAVSEFVFRRWPEADEGTLSRLRSSLVKDSTLAEVATNLGIGAHLILGPGEKKTGGHRRTSILADAMEAVFAAVYLDAGFDAARDVIHRAYADRLTDLADSVDLRDPKTRLQELLQSQKIPLPSYRVVTVSGKAHQQSFEVSCSIDEPSLQCNGQGESRRAAEQDAAAAMLAQLGKAQ